MEDDRGTYPPVNVYLTMERSTIFNGKTHYFDWAIFNSYVTNYQRVFHIGWGFPTPSIHLKFGCFPGGYSCCWARSNVSLLGMWKKHVVETLSFWIKTSSRFIIIVPIKSPVKQRLISLIPRITGEYPTWNWWCSRWTVYPQVNPSFFISTLIVYPYSIHLYIFFMVSCLILVQFQFVL